MTMYCSEEISRKIKVLSFCAMVTVVMIHADFASLHENLSSLTVGLSVFAKIIKKWAVPYFFMVSGFFFDRGLVGRSFGCRDIILKKWRGLGLPYLLWGVVYGVIMFVPLSAVVNRAHGVALLSGTPFDPLEAFPVVDKMFGFFHGAPANGALWYVRMLLILFILAPVWRWVRCHCSLILLVMGLPLSAYFGVTGNDVVHFSLRVPLTFDISWGAFGYFALGMWASARRYDAIRVPLFGSVISIVAAVVLACFVDSFHVALLLVVGIWGAYDYLPNLFPSKLPWVVGLSFWCYCMHLPLAGYVGMINRAVLGRGELSYWMQFVLNPALVIGMCLVCAYLVRRFSLRLFEVLNGGRH